MSWDTCLVMSYFAWYACISFPMKALAAAALGLHWRNIIIMLYMRICYGYIMVMLWLLLRCCFSQEWGCVIAALPARREWTYLQLLWLLTSPSNFLALTLPTLGLANSVNSKTIGAVNRINNTLSWNSLWASLKRKKKKEEIGSKVQLFGYISSILNLEWKILLASVESSLS